MLSAEPTAVSTLKPGCVVTLAPSCTIFWPVVLASEHTQFDPPVLTQAARASLGKIAMAVDPRSAASVRCGTGNRRPARSARFPLVALFRLSIAMPPVPRLCRRCCDSTARCRRGGEANSSHMIAICGESLRRIALGDSTVAELQQQLSGIRVHARSDCNEGRNRS